MGNVLIAHDDVLTRRELVDLVIRAGHRALEAQSTQQASLWSSTERLDLLIVDVALGGVAAGVDLVQAIRDAQPPWVHIPAVFITTIPQGSLAMTARQLPDARVVMAPFHPKDITSMLSAYVPCNASKWF